MPGFDADRGAPYLLNGLRIRPALLFTRVLQPLMLRKREPSQIKCD